MNLGQTFVEESTATLARPAEHRSRISRALAEILVWSVLSVAVILAYSWVWREAPFRTSDTARYLQAAADLSDGSMDTYQARTPGLPMFLLLFGTGRAFFAASLALHVA